MLSPKPSKRYRYGNMEYWAEKGSVHMLDVETMEYSVQSPREMKKRAEFIRLNAQADHYRPLDRQEQRALADNIDQLIKIAEYQGDPTDARVVADVLKSSPPRLVFS